MKIALMAIALTVVACGNGGSKELSMPTGKIFSAPGQGFQEVAVACTVWSECARPDFAECALVVDAPTKICLYQPCTPGQSVCPSFLPVCDSTVNYCRRDLTPADGGAPDGGMPPICSLFCLANNTCVFNATTNTITCIPPSTPLDGGVLPPDAGVQTSDAGTVVLDAGVVALDAGTSIQDAGVTPADGGVPLDGGVAPVDGGVFIPPGSTPVVPPGAYGVLRMVMDPARVCSNGAIVAWSDPTNWSNFQTNGTLSFDLLLSILGTIDTTVRCGVSTADFPWLDNQTARAIGYQVLAYYRASRGWINLLDSAVTCNQKLVIPIGEPFGPLQCE